MQALPPPPPDTSEFRSPWCVNILIGTIKRGGFFTTNVWAPKEVWQQPVVVPVQIEKISSLYCATEYLDKLSNVKPTEISSVTF